MCMHVPSLGWVVKKSKTWSSGPLANTLLIKDITRPSD